MAKEGQPQYFGEEIKLALDIAKKYDDRVINVTGTNKLPVNTIAYAIMLPPQTSSDPFSVYYLDNADPLITRHYILHELGHIVRMLKAPRQERLYAGQPSENVNKASKDLQAEIDRFLHARGMPKEQFPEIFQTLYSSLVNILVNFPMDIRVEQWIHDTFPSVRTTQNSFLKQEVKNAEDSFNDTITSEAFPSTMYRHKAMIAARAVHIASLCEDTSILEPFANPKIMQLGERLVQIILAPVDEGNRSDMRAIDNWAKELNMDGWYQWVRHGESKE